MGVGAAAAILPLPPDKILYLCAVGELRSIIEELLTRLCMGDKMDDSCNGLCCCRCVLPSVASSIVLWRCWTEAATAPTPKSALATSFACFFWLCEGAAPLSARSGSAAVVLLGGSLAAKSSSAYKLFFII